jgi:hypothetical protein
MLDVFFISMGEEGSEANWQRLLSFVPNAKRVDNVKGIYEVHKACARLSTTKNFYVADADAWVLDGFKFHWEPDSKTLHWGIPETECVLVWPSRNPVNGLEYGYGGIKMFPREPFLENKPWNIDLSTTIGRATVSKEKIGCETRFNATPESAWIGAFRECAKLSSLITIKNRIRQATTLKNADLEKLANYINSQSDWDSEHSATYRKVKTMMLADTYDKQIDVYSYWEEIEECSRRRLHWASVGRSAPNGQYTILGAQAGSNFGLQYSDNLPMLDKINDWDWLKGEFTNVNV